MTQHAPTVTITALQLELATLMEELEGLVVGPLPRGRSGVRAAARLARVGQDISTLSMACEVLLRRSANPAEATGLHPPTKR